MIKMSRLEIAQLLIILFLLVYMFMRESMLVNQYNECVIAHNKLLNNSIMSGAFNATSLFNVTIYSSNDLDSMEVRE